MENNIIRALFVSLLNRLSNEDRHIYDVWKHKSVNWVVTAWVWRDEESFWLWFPEDWWDKIIVPEVNTIPYCTIQISNDKNIEFILSL